MGVGFWQSVLSLHLTGDGYVRIHYMKLAGYDAARYHLQLVRELTEGELSKHESYRPIVSESRNRLQLFQILSLNYDEWGDYLKSLLNAQLQPPEDAMLHLDRL